MIKKKLSKFIRGLTKKENWYSLLEIVIILVIIFGILKIVMI